MTVVSRFTPSLQSRETLEKLFVARIDLLERLVDRVVDAAATTSRNHTLVVGPRGSGKTHLLALVYYRTKDLIDRGERLQLAWLPEDPWGIVSYRHLLSEIRNRIEPAPAEPGTRHTEEALEAELRALAQAHGPIVVLAENFDQILEQIGDHGQQRLRHLLQTSRPLLVVATTTALDRNLSDQARPFYGFFTTTALRPFTLDQAVEMLQAIAHAQGNAELAKRLETPRLRGRLRAIAHLAGGQPRLWALLGEGLEIGQLNRLVDMLLTRFDDLTPYYQERLARLAPQQRLVVIELADAYRPLHVAALAQRLDIDQRSLGKTMTELHDLGWIAPVRTPVTQLMDRRRTYYELTEPLLRIAFQIKESRGEPLPLVIDFLKAWFDPEHLTGAGPGSYLAQARESLASDPAVPIGRWFQGETNLPIHRVPAVGLLGTIDDALRALHSGDPEPFLTLPSVIRVALEERLAADDPDTLGLLRAKIHGAALNEVGTRNDPDQDVPGEHRGPDTWIARAEDLAATTGPLGQTILLRWYLQGRRLLPAEAVLDAMSARLGPTDPAVLRGRAHLADARGSAGEVAAAVAAFTALLEDATGVLAPTSAEILAIRDNLAMWRGRAGDPVGAAQEYAQLVTVLTQLRGPDDTAVLTARNHHAFWRGQAGDVTGAVGEFQRLVADATAAFGPDDPRTLTARGNLALWRGHAGDPDRAAAEFAELITDQQRVLGPDHPATLTSRNNLAGWRLEAGDLGGAATDFEVLLGDQERFLGPDHPETLTTRNNLALLRGRQGDSYAALDAFERLLPDLERVLGAEHPRTLATRGNLAFWRGETGAPKAAAAAFDDLLRIHLRVLGPNHPDTLTTRHNLAMWQGKSGDLNAAVAAFEALLPDVERTQGPHHPGTITTKKALEHWRRAQRRKAK